MNLESFMFRGRKLEVVELFQEFLIVQDAESKDIFLLSYEQIDQNANVEYDSNNVFSLQGYVAWLRKTKITDASRANQPQKSSKSPKSPQTTMAKLLYLRSAAR